MRETRSVEVTKPALKRGLILLIRAMNLVPLNKVKIVLIDEIHNIPLPRYFYAKGYQDRQIRMNKKTVQ
jgi:superfamily II DNA or RNA helicase